MKKSPRKVVESIYKWPSNYRELIKAAPKQLAAPPTPKLTSEQISRWLSTRDYNGRPKPETEREAFEFELSYETHESEHEVRPLLNVKTDFYKRHTTKHSIRGSVKCVLKGQDPFTLILNPPFTGDGRDRFNPSVWYAIYRYGYWVRVEQSVLHPMYGPHTAKLFIQICGHSGFQLPQQEWLGTSQFDCVFASEERIRIQLRRAIRTRDYFCSEACEEIPIVFARTKDDQSTKLDEVRL